MKRKEKGEEKVVVFSPTIFVIIILLRPLETPKNSL